MASATTFGLVQCGAWISCRRRRGRSRSSCRSSRCWSSCRSSRRCSWRCCRRRSRCLSTHIDFAHGLDARHHIIFSNSQGSGSHGSQCQERQNSRRYFFCHNRFLESGAGHSLEYPTVNHNLLIIPPIRYLRENQIRILQTSQSRVSFHICSNIRVSPRSANRSFPASTSRLSSSWISNISPYSRQTSFPSTLKGGPSICSWG